MLYATLYLIIIQCTLQRLLGASQCTLDTLPILHWHRDRSPRIHDTYPCTIRVNYVIELIDTGEGTILPGF